MEDMEDIQLKSEIDQIMQSVNNIMNKIEELNPNKDKEAGQPDNIAAAK